jgi:hypothetical protein
MSLALALPSRTRSMNGLLIFTWLDIDAPSSYRGLNKFTCHDVGHAEMMSPPVIDLQFTSVVRVVLVETLTITAAPPLAARSRYLL